MHMRVCMRVCAAIAMWRAAALTRCMQHASDITDITALPRADCAAVGTGQRDHEAHRGSAITTSPPPADDGWSMDHADDKCTDDDWWRDGCV